MTEDEAKMKMCCGPQIVATAVAMTLPADRVEILPHAGRCIASACMAWREGKPIELMSVNSTRTTQVPTGYCGLAGAPQ